MTTRSALTLDCFSDPLWQMTFGERLALEGLLTQVRPKLAIETGTAQGGSLRRIATHADEVHAFDIVPEVAELGLDIPNAQFHIGDSRVLLPEVLAGFVENGRHVDFALIDGDHSYDGVRADVTAVVDSDACRETVIVFHDSANDEVRAGLESLNLPAHPKVALCMWDFVPGYLVMPEHEHYAHAAWNGLGLVVLGARAGDQALTLDDRYSVAEVYQRFRAVVEQEQAPAATPASPITDEAPAPAAGRLAPMLAAAGAGIVAGVGATLLARRS